MNAYFRRIIENRIKELDEKTEFQKRQVEVLSQRLEDYKKAFKQDAEELMTLREILAEDERGAGTSPHLPQHSRIVIG